MSFTDKTYLSVDRKMSTGSSGKGAESEEQNDDLEVCRSTPSVDNSKSVLLKIATLYAEQLMSDIVLEVAGVNYKAHRLILCSSSEVFQVMLMNRDWTEWSESHIVLQETPSAATVFPHFLKYFYTGHIKISHQTVLPVLSLADKYIVKDLVSLCLCYMSNHIAQAAKRAHLISWMQYTLACGHNEVAKACQNFVKWNLEWVCADQLGELDVDALLQLLSHSDLVIHDEYSLYDIVVRWLERQRERFESSDMSDAEKKANWESLVTAVFSQIRFPMMGPRQLAKLLLSPLTQEHKDFFMERMASAMTYQSGQMSSSNNLGSCVTPRLYTEDTWGSVLCVDNYHSLPCYDTRTFIFSTKGELSDVEPQDKLTEWTLDLYPKGVWFKKSLLIVWAGTYDVPEVVLRTVRISITCQNPPECTINEYGDVIQDEPDIRVKIGILIWGVQQGVEHVASVVERVHRFSSQNRVLNIDGALDFDELNTPLYTPSSNHDAPVTPKRCGNCNGVCNITNEGPRPLVGPNRDQLKIQIVIMPLTDMCQTSAADITHG